MKESRFSWTFANRSHKAKGAWYASLYFVYNKVKDSHVCFTAGQLGHWWNPLHWTLGINLDMLNKYFGFHAGIFYFNITVYEGF